MATKICAKCKKEKDFDDFHTNRRKKDGKQSYCKICLNENAKRDYRVNKRKDTFIDRSKKNRQRCKKLVNDIKIKYGCCLCQEREACCLDFHHFDKDEKDVNVSYLADTKSKKRMLIEMQKCCIVCSNCHRKIHAGLLTVTKNDLCKIISLCNA